MHAITAKPSVLIVGGPDVDARLQLMRQLSDAFDVGALGSLPALRDRFSADGFAYHTYHLSRQINPFSDSVTVSQLMLIFRRLRPQIVHAFDTKPGVWGCVAARLAGVPVVIGTVTGLGSLYGSQKRSIQLAWAIYRALQKLACSFSDLTIFQNHDDARHFIAAGLVPAEKALVILGSGVTTDVFAPSRVPEEERARLRGELGLKPQEILVTMVSRVMRSKGVLEFAAAARDVHPGHPHARFLLVGPEDEGSLDRLSAAEVIQLMQTVTWLGARRDIAALLAVSDIFVLPSAYREGIPRVLLEAASMGLPLITTDSPGCNEVVQDGINGLVVPALDAAALSKAITHLVEHPQLRRRFGLASRQRAIERFDLSAIAAQTRNAYQQLLSCRTVLPATEP